MAPLTLSPGWSLSKTTRVTAFEAQLGDGYSQHTGITAYKSLWDLAKVFQARELEQAKAAIATLRHAQGDQVFQWSPGFDIPEFDCYCANWSTAELGEPRPGAKTIEIQAQFEEQATALGHDGSAITVGDTARDPLTYPIAPFSRDWAIAISEETGLVRAEFRGGVVERDRHTIVHPIRKSQTLTGPVYDFAAVDRFFRALGGKPFRILDNTELWRCNEWTLTAESAGNSHRSARWRFSGQVVQVFRAVLDSDRRGPSAQLRPIRDITTPAHRVEFAVIYRDPDGVDLATISANDITVTGPNGYVENASFLGRDGSTGFYQVVAAGGAWDFSDNGSYDLQISRNEVFDDKGNPALPDFLGNFIVQLPPPDLQPPSAQLLSADNIDTPDGISLIRIQFGDDRNLDRSSINGNEIRLVRRIDGTVLTPLFFGERQGQATYRLEKSSNWNAADLGDYEIEVLAGTVQDTAGNTIAQTVIGQLTIAIEENRLLSLEIPLI